MFYNFSLQDMFCHVVSAAALLLNLLLKKDVPTDKCFVYLLPHPEPQCADRWGKLRPAKSFYIYTK